MRQECRSSSSFPLHFVSIVLKLLYLHLLYLVHISLTRSRLYFEGSGSFDWKIDPYYDCNDSDTSVRCLWHDSLSQLQPGIPYDIPRVTTSLTNGSASR